MSLAKYLNSLEVGRCEAELRQCCAAEAWVRGMLDRRPFDSSLSVRSAAETIWKSLSEADWREAFEAHPRIGDLTSLQDKFGATRDWAEGEQSGAAAADIETLQRLADLNQKYLDRFGYLFIVCATGKTAAQMLALLKARLPNRPEVEIKIAAAEQLKITLLRLAKLVP